MISLGFKRKELSGASAEVKTPDNWDEELVEPEVCAEGKQAVAMGAEDLKAGEEFTAPVKFKVKEVSKTDVDGKVSYRLRLCMVAMGDMETEAETESDDSDETSDDKGDSPMAEAMRAMGND